VKKSDWRWTSGSQCNKENGEGNTFEDKTPLCCKQICISNNMASSRYQKRKEEIKRVHTALANGENLLSCEEAHFEMSKHAAAFWE
jgi:hypothetical protein